MRQDKSLFKNIKRLKINVKIHMMSEHTNIFIMCPYLTFWISFKRAFEVKKTQLKNNKIVFLKLK